MSRRPALAVPIGGSGDSLETRCGTRLLPRTRSRSRERSGETWEGSERVSQSLRVLHSPHVWREPDARS